MGKRLHVQKKHVIEYADCAYFNWCVEDINSLLSTFIEGYWGNDEEYGNYSDSIEIPKESFKEFLDWFKDDTLRAEKFDEHDYELPDEISDVEELVNDLQELYDNADPDNGCIYLDWF